jgi:hypothetical protein
MYDLLLAVFSQGQIKDLDFLFSVCQYWNPLKAQSGLETVNCLKNLTTVLQKEDCFDSFRNKGMTQSKQRLRINPTILFPVKRTFLTLTS